MTHHFIPPPTSPRSNTVAAAHPPPMVLDPHRRTLFIQRLAILIQRLRPVTTSIAKEDVSYDH
jgi:hypothetical protein